MSRVSELIVKIRGDVSGAMKGIREVSGEVGKLARETRSAFGGFDQAFEQMSRFGTRMTVGLTLPMAALGAAAIKADADLDALTRGLTAVSGSSAEAQRQLARLTEVAKQPGLGFEEAVRGSINLQAAGLAAELSERSIAAFGNALATVGKGKADLDGVILALGQIESKGKVSAEEINQIAERVPQIRQAMKAAFGTADTEQIQKMGLSTTEFINKIVTEFEKLPKASGGVKNAFENVQDSIKQSLGEVGKSMRPATEAFLAAAEPLIKQVGEVAKGLRDWSPAAQIAVGGILTVGGALPPLLVGVGQLGLGITGIATGAKLLGAMGLGAILASIKTGVVAVGAAIAALGWPVAVAAAAIAALGVAASTMGGVTADYKAATDSLKLDSDKLLKSLAPVPPKFWEKEAAARAAKDRMKELGNEIPNVSEKYRELGGAMQGPKTLMEEVSAVIGRRQQNEAAKAIEEAADAMERGGVNGALLQLRYAQVGDQTEQLTFRQQILKSAWDELNAATGASDAQLRSYLFTMRAITGDETLQRMQKLAEAYKAIGYSAEEAGKLDRLNKARDVIRSQGGDKDAIRKADIEVLKERRRLGEKLTKQELEDLAKAEQANQSAATKTQTLWTEAASRVKTGFSALSTDLTKLILKGGNFGDVMVDALSKIGQSLLSLGIEKALGKILDYAGKLAKQIPGIGGALGKIGGIFGGGGMGNAPISASGVPSIPSGGLASAAGGLTGMFGAIGSIGSMVSGIIGNFQQASMNSKLKAMESQLRGLLSQTIHNTERYNDFLPALPAIHQRLMEIRQIGVRVFTTDAPLEVMVAGGGLAGGGITINMAGSSFIGFRDLDAFLDELARRLRQRM